MTNVILAAPNVPGELAPMLTIGQSLQDSGHTVTVLAGACMSDVVGPSGLRHVPITGSGDVDVRRLTELFPQLLELPPGPPQLAEQWIHAFFDVIPEQHNFLQQLLAADPDSVLIANSLFLGAWPTALGVPGRAAARWVGVGANPILLPSDHTTWFGPLEAADGDAVAAHRAWNVEFLASLAPADRHLAQVLARMGATHGAPPFIIGMFTLPDRFAALSVPGFEFDRPDAPPSFHLVGALPARSGKEWTPPDWWSDLDDDRPVVVVTQGTLANFDLGESVEPAVQALGGRDVLVVAALGRPARDIRVPVADNIRVTEFVPFGPLFERADLYITNGGLGGTQQALAAGIPVIVAGATEDKPAVAARVARHGLGLDLGTGTPSPEQIAGAVKQVLADPGFTVRAQQLAKVYTAHDALAEIAKIAELRPRDPGARPAPGHAIVDPFLAGGDAA